jgi:hypothetical protein
MKKLFKAISAITAIAALTTLSATFTACESEIFDPTELTQRVDDLEGRVGDLEKAVAQSNKDIETLQGLVEALKNGLTIEKVTRTDYGYEVLLTNGEKLEIRNGGNGSNAPVIGVAEFEGAYYWTVTTDGTTEWLTDGDGNKLRVTGNDGQPGGSGDHGKTPVIGVDGDGYWTVTLDGVTTRINDAGGNPVKAQGQKGDDGENGDSFFKSVTEDDTSVTFTLADDTVIVLPKKTELTLSIQYANPNTRVQVKYGEVFELDVQQTGKFDYIISKPDGWKVSFNGEKLLLTAPVEANPYAEMEGTVSFLVITSTRASHEIAKINVAAGEESRVLHTVTFEGGYWEPLVAANYNGATYTNRVHGNYTYPLWVDETTQLTTDYPTWFNDDRDSSIGFDYPWILSSYNTSDISSYGYYDNDLYVYDADSYDNTHGGGNNDSDNFLVAFGYYEPDGMYSFGDFRPVFKFADGRARTIKSICINATTYFLSVFYDGNGLSPALAPGEEVWWEATGIDADGNETGKVTMIFAEYGRVVSEWTEWDLSELGAVVALKLNQGGGTDNGYGYSLPAYYAIDDVTVVME